MSLSLLCCRCHKEPKNVSHALWGCKALKTLKTLSKDCSFLGNLSLVIYGSILDFLLFYRSVLSPFNVQLFGIIFWKSWHLRNCHVHQLSCLVVEVVIHWCKDFMANFAAAREVPALVRVG
ncbi:hypothetical protein ACOSP7_021219 [Xanthoceras sorbifolium]